MKKTILIFGASSFLGSNLFKELGEEYRVVGTYYKNPIIIPGALTLPCDVLKKESVSAIISRIKPHIVIYAVGMSSLKESSLNPKLSENLNSLGAINCLIASQRIDAKFVYFSSAFVSGGEPTLFKEGDVPFSNTVYGAGLSSTEFYIQRSSLNYIILRCPVLYGRSTNLSKRNWFEELERAYYQQEKLEVDDQVIVGFLDVRILARILIAVLSTNVYNRLLNISSSDYMTRFRFAEVYGDVFKKDSSFLVKTTGTFPFDKAKNNDPLKTNFRLDVRNIESLLGIKMPTVEESLHSTLKRFKV